MQAEELAKYISHHTDVLKHLLNNILEMKDRISALETALLKLNETIEKISLYK